MNKKALTKTAIHSKLITPAQAGTNGSQRNLHTKIHIEPSHRSHYLAHGRPVKRREAQKPNDLLPHKPNLPPAVIKANAHTHAVGGRMQQALEYAENPDAPNAHSNNGQGFPQHDRTATGAAVTRKIPLDQFPSPAELRARYRAGKGLTPQQQVVATPDQVEAVTRRTPRHYQQIAINRTINTIARMESDRLLTMVTGTGNTYTAFQIIRRLWKSSARRRIPFLVDRNVLADQTKTNDFKPFGTAMTKINNRAARKPSESSLRAQRSNPVTRLGFQTRNTRASNVAELLRRCAPRDNEFLRLWTLYQAVTGVEEEQNIYKQFSPGFFDRVIIDECHRGSAADDAAWRKVLEYFSAATQIGLTATPKETKDVSNIEYFGDPIYTYSLRQGISDGFLTPYKVVRIGIDKDLDGWRPEIGQTDKYGNTIEDREYNDSDYDRHLILEKRTTLVAAKITEFLRATDRFAKTIVFCENIDDAERMLLRAGSPRVFWASPSLYQIARVAKNRIAGPNLQERCESLFLLIWKRNHGLDALRQKGSAWERNDVHETQGRIVAAPDGGAS